VESGIVSLRTVAAEGFVEIATIGYRGAIGSPVCWAGIFQRINQSYSFLEAQSGLAADDFWRVFGEHPEFRCRLLRYVQGLAIHEAQTAFCAVRHKLEQRLASWLCLSSDILDGASWRFHITTFPRLWA